MEFRKKIFYKDWKMTVQKNGTLIITKNGETRVYDIPEPITKAEQEKEYPEYVRIDVRDDEIGYYLFKFEENEFLVADKWSEDNDHLGEYAAHVFGEEI